MLNCYLMTMKLDRFAFRSICCSIVKKTPTLFWLQLWRVRIVHNCSLLPVRFVMLKSLKWTQINLHRKATANIQACMRGRPASTVSTDNSLAAPIAAIPNQACEAQLHTELDTECCWAVLIDISCVRFVNFHQSWWIRFITWIQPWKSMCHLLLGWLIKYLAYKTIIAK